MLLGDCVARMKGLPDQSIQMCVTSPPYFGLRDYGHDGQIGLEDTPEQFIAKLVEVFREVRRVLADDGTLWVNIGDSYARNPSKGGSGPGGKNGAYSDSYTSAQAARIDSTDYLTEGRGRAKTKLDDGVKHKDLIGIPWMLAFALRADGWYLRQEIIWHKPNPMPESVTDRCTKSHETLFLLAKSPQYFFDSEAVKEEAVNTRKPGRKITDTRETHGTGGGNSGINSLMARYHNGEAPTHRNRRSVWTIATRPYKGAHFAVFPPALVEPCILAGTSERGHCPECGSRWEREIDRREAQDTGAATGGDPARQDGGIRERAQQGSGGGNVLARTRFATGAWGPTCTCGADPVPDVVLDPFNGSGTTGQVALEHGRQYLGCELNLEYVELTRARLVAVIDAKALASAPSPQSDLFAA